MHAKVGLITIVEFQEPRKICVVLTQSIANILFIFASVTLTEEEDYEASEYGMVVIHILTNIVGQNNLSKGKFSYEDEGYIPFGVF